MPRYRKKGWEGERAAQRMRAPWPGGWKGFYSYEQDLPASFCYGDGGARALAQSPYLKRLVHLNLNDNRIGKAGAETLAAVPHWRHLRKLDLRGNVFTDTQEALLRGRFGSAVLL